MSFAHFFFVPKISPTYVYVISNESYSRETQVEEAAQMLEHLVDGTFHTDAYLSEITSSFVAPDYLNMYWSNTDDPQRQGEKFALIRDIVDAVPEPDVICLLFEIFVTRCQGPLGNVVHTPTFMKQAEKFCACFSVASREAQVMALFGTMSIDALACHLLAVRMPPYRESGVCSHSIFNSSCLLSPFIPHLLYLAGFPRL